MNIGTLSAAELGNRTVSTNFLADAEYSGQAVEGLNLQASYDRMTFLDRRKIWNQTELSDLMDEMAGQFRTSGRSRMVVRVLAAANLGQSFYRKLQELHPGLEMDFYPDAEGRFNYLTIALNIPERAVDGSVRDRLVSEVRNRVNRVSEGRLNFETDALQKINRATEEGYRPTLKIAATELTEIWQPFGWSREAVESLLRGESADIVMGVRNRLGKLMAVALYNDQSHGGIRHGETTEWTTVPEFRGQGVIQPLLITLHSYLLSRGVKNIWADLRTPDPVHRLPNSIEPGLRAGMRIFDSFEHPFISTNHVTIEGPAQSYNQGSAQRFGDVPRDQLRSFVRAWVDGGQFGSRVIDTALNNLI